MRATVLASLVCFTLLGCASTIVREGSGAGGAGGSGDASSSAGPSPSSSDTSAASSSSSAPTKLPPPECRAGEGAVLAADGRASIEVLRVGPVWGAPLPAIPASSRTAYVDPTGAFSVLESAEGGLFFDRSSDDATFIRSPVTQWSPDMGIRANVNADPIGASFMVGTDRDYRASVAFFDADLLDWIPRGGPSDTLFAPSLAADPSGVLTVLGRRGDATLCTSIAESGGEFAAARCRDGVTAPTGGEIPYDPPQIVTLPNGDQVVVFLTPGALAATTHHAGTWSPVAKIASDIIGIDYAATPTAGGDVIAVVTNYGKDVSFFRFGGGVWRGPFSVGVRGDEGVRLVAAPGICGDDALVAFGSPYVTEETPAVATIVRIRGDGGEVEATFDLGTGGVFGLALATRPASGS